FWKFYYNSILENKFYCLGGSTPSREPEGCCMSRIDVVLIGAGRMGQVHGPNAAHTPGLRLKYVVDPREELAREMATATGAAVASLEQALADPDVGGVLVCSSTDQHLDQALAAVAAGKAVFCEKPVDLDPERARRAQPRFDGARFVL